MTERVMKLKGFAGDPLNATQWLDEMQVEAEAGAEQYGPLRGPVQPPQRVWSQLLDTIAAEREEAA